MEKMQHMNSVSEEMKNKINEIKNSYEAKIKDLNSKIEAFKEKSLKKKDKVFYCLGRGKKRKTSWRELEKKEMTLIAFFTKLLLNMIRP